LLLYIQSYKRLLPRSHKDSASVADVWPSTSAFDGYFSALSPLQVKLNSQFLILILAMQCILCT
jgi:TBCC domain-containing protein 1